jgi:2-phospho-L-lactate transferase/gluconeogenesis factor (CofD/UPF0052 family)
MDIASVVLWVERYPDLETLDVQCCQGRLSDESVAKLLHRYGVKRALLTGAMQLTDRMFGKRLLPTLLHVDLSQSRITDVGIQQ